MAVRLGDPCTNCDNGKILPHVEERGHFTGSKHKVVAYGYCDTCQQLYHVVESGQLLVNIAHRQQDDSKIRLLYESQHTDSHDATEPLVYEFAGRHIFCPICLLLIRSD